MNKIYTLLLVAIFTLSSVWAPIASAENVKIDYVALGDSLATGHTPHGVKVGRGYTDMISEAIAKQGMLGSFTKAYATSGETSVGLLETLKRAEVQQSLKEAELITIISGANDFIDELYDPSNGHIDADVAKATTLLNTVAGNLTAAIQQVKSLSPDADIYLHGYFFPIPSLDDEATKMQLQIAFNLMNAKLRAVAEGEGIHFVEVASVFDLNGAIYLENPKDIHPNEAGYQVMADQFFQNYSIHVNAPFPNISSNWDNKINKAESVAPNKKWTITLNKDVHPTSVKKAVYVVKDGTSLVQVGVEISKDNPKQIIITAPKQGYKSGAYQLMVTNDLQDKSGKSLKTNVLMNFQVQ
ncbi:GDSL-type esterase/lipase family protein [Psychrobacillus sp.]|uniref:GDSL-type esterase/lipase family protein n=1 Tax=Psychrobacillus sp. TaxID=1871623 RepID=UPI0028BD8371|nr:GDSL-type esterase/lipase family protein [Psychrobacillus sp.]